MAVATNSTGTSKEQGRLWDDRGFYRKALAAVAPLPMLAMGVNYLLLDLPGSGPFNDIVASAARQESVLVAMSWVTLLFFAFLIPAVLAVVTVSRLRAPLLSAAGAVLTVPGFAVGFGTGPDDTQLALLTHQENLDAATVASLDNAMWGVPAVGLAALLFILGITIGIPLIGVALTRSQVVPKGFGVALIVGGFTHPFMPTHTLAGIGLIIAAVGFAGASIGLLRLGNEELAPKPCR